MSPGKKTAGRLSLLVWVAYWVGALGWQVSSGAWGSDFGGHADEAAHVVTGLMVRDYLAGGFLEQWHPLRYAEAYYERFPKVAIGHYPPAFYLLEALFFLPWRAPGAALVMMTTLAATLGWQTWRLARVSHSLSSRDAGRTRLREARPGFPAGLDEDIPSKENPGRNEVRAGRSMSQQKGDEKCGLARERIAGEIGPLSLGLLVIWLPLVRTYTAIVMSDLLLAILILEATRAFGCFLESDRRRDAWAFGFLAAAAILTKGSGLMLALVPPLAILISGRWRVLKSPRLWVAPIPVLALALPWMLATRHITAEGMSARAPGDYLAEASGFYFRALGQELGWGAMVLLLCAFGGMIHAASRHRRTGTVDQGAAWWALIFGALGFYLAVPSGLDSRYLLPVLPVAVVLAAAGMELPLRKRGSGLRILVAVGFAIMVMFEAARPVEKRYTGGRAGIARVLETTSPDGETSLLVVSDTHGEGALVAAAALDAPDRLRTLRGTKILASSDWMGRGYEVKFDAELELRDLLAAEKVDFIILETWPNEKTMQPGWEHWRRLSALVENAGSVLEIDPLTVETSERKRGGSSAFVILRVRSMAPVEANPENGGGISESTPEVETVPRRPGVGRGDPVR